jgi:MFS superfamily sulfate permease-like transporter
MDTKNIPQDGLAGLKQNFMADAISGFIVFLLALPLSLGIAKASEFPPIMGLITAIIGGIVVSFMAGSKLTIKGPAAGLIVIVAEAVREFGGAEVGWHLALGAMFVAAVIQVLFGVFKLGKFSDFFPLSAIHGMLAAIGIIILAKQIPVLLDIDPALTKGKSPFALIGEMPNYIMHNDHKATLIGVVCLFLMLIWQFIDHPIRKIPAPLAVLMFAIPAELLLNFKETEPAYALVKLGSLVENINFNLDFGGLAHPDIFIKYVIMFALVGTIESLLTVKAIDLMDPFKRKSDTNKDLIAVGVGNLFSSMLGGMPMISEVARSSANVNNGGKTRWANFFHGLFILLFVLFATPLIELIPNTALAAMLISVGIKLAHPKEFIHMFHIGKEQLAIFLVTIFFTLYEDLLIGIAAGIALKFIIHLISGAPIKSLFRAPVEISSNEENYLVTVDKSALFSNFLGIKEKLDEIPPMSNLTIDLQNTKLVDHSAMQSFYEFKRSYEADGGTVNIIGLDDHKPNSNHELASRKK